MQSASNQKKKKELNLSCFWTPVICPSISPVPPPSQVKLWLIPGNSSPVSLSEDDTSSVSLICFRSNFVSENLTFYWFHKVSALLLFSVTLWFESQFKVLCKFDWIRVEQFDDCEINAYRCSDLIIVQFKMRTCVSVKDNKDNMSSHWRNFSILFEHNISPPLCFFCCSFFWVKKGLNWVTV